MYDTVSHTSRRKGLSQADASEEHAKYLATFDRDDTYLRVNADGSLLSIPNGRSRTGAVTYQDQRAFKRKVGLDEFIGVYDAELEALALAHKSSPAVTSSSTPTHPQM
jgi:hypothetical protein